MDPTHSNSSWLLSYLGEIWRRTVFHHQDLFEDKRWRNDGVITKIHEGGTVYGGVTWHCMPQLRRQILVIIITCWTSRLSGQRHGVTTLQRCAAYKGTGSFRHCASKPLISISAYEKMDWDLTQTLMISPPHTPELGSGMQRYLLQVLSVAYGVNNSMWVILLKLSDCTRVSNESDGVIGTRGTRENTTGARVWIRCQSVRTRNSATIIVNVPCREVGLGQYKCHWAEESLQRLKPAPKGWTVPIP